MCGGVSLMRREGMGPTGLDILSSRSPHRLEGTNVRSAPIERHIQVVRVKRSLREREQKLYDWRLPLVKSSYIRLVLAICIVRVGRGLGRWWKGKREREGGIERGTN